MTQHHLLSSSSGSVFLVGAGPGDIELLTLKAARLLAQADVVLIDDLAGEAVLSLCPQARVIHVGKRGGCKSTPQAFIEKLLWGGKVVGLRIVIAAAPAALLKSLVHQAWAHKAPKGLQDTRP